MNFDKIKQYLAVFDESWSAEKRRISQRRAIELDKNWNTREGLLKEIKEI